MRYTFHTGRHRAWPPSFDLSWNKREVVRLVSFDESCKYTLPGQDQFDTNKLFGVGYCPTWKWAAALAGCGLLGLLSNEHHKESARFGWHWEPEKAKLILSAYCYVNSERSIIELCELKFNTWYLMSIFLQPDSYQFEVADSANTFYKLSQYKISRSHPLKGQFHLGPYFGGNYAAPKSMFLEIKKR